MCFTCEWICKRSWFKINISSAVQFDSYLNVSCPFFPEQSNQISPINQVNQTFVFFKFNLNMLLNLIKNLIDFKLFFMRIFHNFFHLPAFLIFSSYSNFVYIMNLVCCSDHFKMIFSFKITHWIQSILYLHSKQISIDIWVCAFALHFYIKIYCSINISVVKIGKRFHLTNVKMAAWYTY
jgi:hypothetical protein